MTDLSKLFGLLGDVPANIFSPQNLSEHARDLPDGFAITSTLAVEAGLNGLAGVEASGVRCYELQSIG